MADAFRQTTFSIPQRMDGDERRTARRSQVERSTDGQPSDDAQLVDGAVRSSMDQLADWTVDADRILSF